MLRKEIESHFKDSIIYKDAEIEQMNSKVARIS